MAENTLIPNTFQHHNVYVDWLSYYLTPEEEKVLNNASKNQPMSSDIISLPQA